MATETLSLFEQYRFKLRPLNSDKISIQTVEENFSSDPTSGPLGRTRYSVPRTSYPMLRTQYPVGPNLIQTAFRGKSVIQRKNLSSRGKSVIQRKSIIQRKNSSSRGKSVIRRKFIIQGKICHSEGNSSSPFQFKRPSASRGKFCTQRRMHANARETHPKRTVELI